LNVLDEILCALGSIEGELIEIRKLNERVPRLEVGQSWLKESWAAVTAWCYLAWRAATK